MSDPFDALEMLATHLWDRMLRGAAEAEDSFRLVALATAGQQGPEARMVGLRRADRAASEVEVHSDLRTAKVASLQVDPRAALLFWDPVERLQLRLAVEMRLLFGESGRWAQVPAEARTNYGTDPAPGTAVAAPEVVTRRPDPARFVALVGRVTAMDAVSLAHEPHRRACFDGSGGRWVAP